MAVRSGESLRQAVQWISDRRRDEPGLPMWKAIEEAALRFDLSPLDEQFLLQNWKELVQEQPAG